VKHRKRACKPKATFCFTGVSSGGNYSVYNNSVDTIEKALKERVFLVCEKGKWRTPFRPSVAQFRSKTNLFTHRFSKEARYTTPMKAEAFAQLYQGRKRTLLEKAIEANNKWGFTDKSAIVRAFVKHEKYLFSRSKIPIPRLIQPRDHRYIVETGRYIKPIEKLIYKGIDTVFKSKTVFKGLNMEDRGNLLKTKWDRFKRPVAVGLDASKFDRHVSNAALFWEHSVYMKFYPGDRYFKHLMSLQRKNVGRAQLPDGSVSYETIHNRMSGDSNTSLGNVLIMCALIYDYLMTKGINAELANDGDDCQLILESDDLGLLGDIELWFRDAGFILVTETPVYVFEHIEFCQSKPIMNYEGGYTMVRDVRKSLGKDAVALKPLDNANIKKMWLAAVGEGGMALTSGMPVVQSYYQMFKRNSQGAKVLKDITLDGGFFRLSKGMSSTFREPTPQTRLSFWLAFGINPVQQYALEAYYDALTLTEGTLEDRYAIIPID